MPRTWTALHAAAASGGNENVLAVLSRGAIDIDQGDQNGWTPLMVSSVNGYSRIAQILLDQGAAVSTPGDSGLSALHISTQERQLAVAKLLVAAGAHLELGDCHGMTPQHLASEDGHLGVMRVLLGARGKSQLP